MTAVITVELFSASSCNRCGKAKKRLQILIDELGDDRIQYREMDVLEELEYAVSLGILTTPAIAINGELIFTSIPSMKQLRNELQKRILALSP